MAAAHIDNHDTNMQRRCRMRYSVTDDIALLQEVVNLNPFTGQHLWTEVSENIVALTGKLFTERSVKERVDLVLTRFLNEERVCIRRSGTEEHFSAMDQLLQQVADLCKEFGHELCRVALRRSRRRTENNAQALSPVEILLEGIYVDAEKPPGCSSDQQSPPPPKVLPAALTVMIAKQAWEAPVVHSRCSPQQTPRKRPPLQVIHPGNSRTTPAQGMQRHGTTRDFLDERDKREQETQCRRLALEDRRLDIEMLKHSENMREREKEREALAEERRLSA
ncbi:hypothetical protein HPB48_010048 [Haemaphysalis longicornis]|uniref:Uncharacterized protein n=1 Tax=Haemaphysalis longicornis TaxID=44386 RepID=A0A9J6FBL0_HAELO|nr:hypothetical protein HPB48_010048 [Haemaphysalis longicornis]